MTIAASFGIEVILMNFHCRSGWVYGHQSSLLPHRRQSILSSFLVDYCQQEASSGY